MKKNVQCAELTALSYVYLLYGMIETDFFFTRINFIIIFYFISSSFLLPVYQVSGNI